MSRRVPPARDQVKRKSVAHEITLLPNGLTKRLDFAGRVCILSAMPRRVLLALAGCVLFGALGWGPAPPAPPAAGRPPLRSLIADPRLLALERDNGCLDPARRPAPQAWPDWAAAHIAGGDVPPLRVVSDPVSDAAQRRRRSR